MAHTSSSSSQVQDTGLSRRRHGFESRRGCFSLCHLFFYMSSSSSQVQDTGLSRRRHGFKSRRGCFYRQMAPKAHLVLPDALFSFSELTASTPYWAIAYRVSSLNDHTSRQRFCSLGRIHRHKPQHFALYPQAMRSIAGGAGELVPPQKSRALRGGD